MAHNTDVYYMTETCKFESFSKPIYQYTFEMSSVGQSCLSCELYVYLAFCQTICNVHAMEYFMKLDCHQAQTLLWYKWTEV